MKIRLQSHMHEPPFAGRFVFLFFLVVCVFSRPAFAETVVVQIINGRNGKPIAKVRVYIGFGDLKGRQPLNLTTNSLGEVRFETGEAKTFQVHPVGEVACGEQPIGAPYRDYSIDDVLSMGMVTKNDCGRANVEPRRGRLSYFMRPATWWELFKS